MLHILKKLKLKHQLFVLILISMLILVLLQAFYYVRFYYHIEEKSEASTTTILNQVEEGLNGIANDIRKASETVSYNRYTQDLMMATNSGERYENYKFAYEINSYIKSSNKSIYDIILVDMEGRVISSSYNSTSVIVQTLDQIYHFNEKKMLKPEFSILVSDHLNRNYYAYVHTFPMVNISSDIKAGTSIILCNTDHIQSMVNAVNLTPNSLLFILDKEKRVVAANDRSMVGKPVDDVFLQAFSDVNQKTTVNFKGQNCVIQRNKNNFMNWEIVSITPVSEITEDLQSTIRAGTLIGVIMIFILIAVGLVFSWNITRPISNLIRFMNTSAEVNLHQRIEVIEPNEVGQLAVHINTMLQKIQDMTRKIVDTQSSLYELELSKKQAELLALQSQINPHFLYNTLDCIRSIAYSYNAKEIATISTAMAKIFRYSIKGGDIVKVKNEIDCIRDYLDIMCIRYPDKFLLQFEIDDRMMDLDMAKFILQPIVENSIYHGLERKKGQGVLKIKGSLVQGNIYFEITDNGKGIPEADMAVIRQILDGQITNSLGNSNKKPIGLININNRIKHIYGKEYGIKILSKENEGTTVILEIPVNP